MISHTAVFDVKDLKSLLVSRVKDIAPDSYEELLFAILMAKFYSKQSKREFKVGIPVKRNIPKVINEKMDLFSEMILILNNHREKDSPIDFFLIPGDIDLNIKTNRKGYAYQLKRFHTSDKRHRSTQALMKYLREDIPKKYAPIQAGLLLFIGEEMRRIDLKKFSKKFSPTKYPFDMVALLARDQWDIGIYKLWPGFSKFEYNGLDLLADE